MRNDWKPLFLQYDDIREYAARFLKEYQPDIVIPVPIEEIAESRLNISLLVIPGLQKRLYIDSYLESAMDAICIDEEIFSNEIRSRFSIAHEIGHRYLHKEFFEKFKFKDERGYIESIMALSAKEEHWFEMQAYNFAGLILVPPEILREEFDAILKDTRQFFDPYASPSYFFYMAVNRLSKHFLVSKDVIRKRIAYDQLWEIASD